MVNSHDSSTVVQVSSTSSTVDVDDDEFVDNAIDLPQRNFLGPEFVSKSQREVPFIFGDTQISGVDW